MHARMTIAQTQPDRFDEALATVQEAFLPAAQEQPGYRGFLLLTDQATRGLIGISFWESENDLKATSSTGGYYQERMERFGELLESPPTTTIHEVVVREP